MLSARLVRLIEEHWDPLTRGIINEIRGDARLSHIGKLPESDVCERGREIMERLGHWLTLSDEGELTKRFERQGAIRREEGVPIDEVVLVAFMIKRRMVEFVRAQGMGANAMEVYAEEELEHEVGHFFDSMVYHLVRGYVATPAAVAASGARR